jgi:hypothetical protein
LIDIKASIEKNQNHEFSSYSLPRFLPVSFSFSNGTIKGMGFALAEVSGQALSKSGWHNKIDRQECLSYAA